MSINNVIDLIESKLLEDAEWGNAIFYGNLDSFQNDYSDDDLPNTCIHSESMSIVENSTLSDQTSWEFSIKGVFWVGEKVTTKANFLEYLRLNTLLVTIYNNIVNDLECAWITDYLRTDFESIDERMTITGRFTIMIETIR